MYSSFTRAIKAEHLKLKRSPVWLAFFALPVISAFFGTNNYLMNQGILQSEWFSLWSQHSLFLCFFFMPALIGTFCSYLWRLEHLRTNWNSFLTTPVPLLCEDRYPGQSLDLSPVLSVRKTLRSYSSLSATDVGMVPLRRSRRRCHLQYTACPLHGDPFFRRTDRHRPARRPGGHAPHQ